MTATPLPPTWITLMPEAEQIVKGKHVYKRFIDGTPLSNDVPCWMVEFALEQVAQARADLEAENQRLRDVLRQAESKLIELEHAVGGGDDEIYVEGVILSIRAALGKQP